MQLVAPYKFSPSSLSIKRCDAVKAVYADTTGAPHTWTSTGHWDSGDLTSAGQSYTYRFASTGTFSFFCSYHQSFGMTGKVTVS